MTAKFYCHAPPARPTLLLCDAIVIGLLSLFFYAPAARAQAPAPLPPGNATSSLPGLEPPVKDNPIFMHVLLDQFEGRTNGPNNERRWDGEGWIGTDTNRLWLKSEGFINNGTVSDGDHEALYDRPIPHMRYFDAQVGVRADLDSGPSRTWAAVGIEGLAPYFFAFAPTFYIRDGGHVAGRVTGLYDLLLTQRWIVQPEAELNFYSMDDPSRRIGSGLSDLDTGVRLRYEFSRNSLRILGMPIVGNMATRPAIRVRREKPQATTASYSGFDYGSEIRLRIT